MSIPEEYADDIDLFLEESYDKAREMAVLLMQDMMNKKAGKVAPDTIGADFFFLEGFVTNQMQWDFPYIEKDFIKHCYGQLPEYDRVVWYSANRARYSTPELALRDRIMGLMYNGAKLGDEYCVTLIKYLHKLYHKKEYNQLKRFHKISVEEILSLAEKGGKKSYTAIGRILVMSTLYGIELEEKCSVLYLWLNKVKDRWDADYEEETAFKDFEPGVFEECSRQVDEWYEDEQQKKRQAGQFKKYWNVDKFVCFCLRHWGYPEEYVARCLQNDMGLRVQFSRTYAVLKSVYPSKEFTFEDVQLYTHLYSALAALVDVSDQCDLDVDSLLGVEEDCFDEEEEPLFKPENMPLRPSSLEKKPVRKPEVNLAPVSLGEAGKEDYQEEIAKLRKRLNEKEQENQHLREMYQTVRMARNETEELLKKYEGDREELIALREFAYKSAIEEDTSASLSLDEMKAGIADLKLVIIGGHTNWIKKLKSQFPGWTFIPPNAYKSVDGKMLEGKDHIYFFTDYISHAAYGKFISIVRSRKIPFGYLGNVNLDAMVRLIYMEMKG